MAENGNCVEKPTVLILGGVGFVGRNLIQFLVENALCNRIIVADKVIPAMAWLNAGHKASFAQVEYRQVNLINAESVKRLFSTDVKFDFVINCAAETKLGQTAAVYDDGVYKLSCNCARESARHGVLRYIELSTALMQSSDKKALDEDCVCEPWTALAENKHRVEKALSNIPQLNYVIIRPAIIYGIGDRTGLTPRLVLGAVYKYLNERLQMLWTRDFKLNTVHVHDVVRAIWHLCHHGNSGSVYNVVDHGDTTQGRIGDIIEDLFEIRSEYLGTLSSNFVKLNMDEVVEDINEKHMGPWGEACQCDAITNTPLTPYITKEQLCNKPIFVDGRKLEVDTNFIYERPQLTKNLLQDVLVDYMTERLFPPFLVTRQSDHQT